MIKQILNPDLYHGDNKKENCFEGWYFKISDIDNDLSMAFIPGIIKGHEGHSFIQYVNGFEKQFSYFTFSKDDFKASKSEFNISIGKNNFSIKELKLDLRDENIKIKVDVNFSHIDKWPDSTINPGSMGFYNYLPFMECYSQVCAVNGYVSGAVEINDKKYILNKGKIYIEKNWGKKFPYSWFWMQSNCFSKDISITCSIAHIPFPISSFRGFLIGLKFNNKFIKFTTINKSKLTTIKTDRDVRLVVTNKEYELTLESITNSSEFLLLHGPTGDKMQPFVKESITSKLHLVLRSFPEKKIVLEDTGIFAGIEYGGNFEELFF